MWSVMDIMQTIITIAKSSRDASTDLLLLSCLLCISMKPVSRSPTVLTDRNSTFPALGGTATTSASDCRGYIYTIFFNLFQ